MKKERGLVFLVSLFIIVLSSSFIFAESVVVNSMIEFKVGPVANSNSYSIWNLNNILAVTAAVLLIIAAIFLIKRKKKVKKSKKKKF